MQTLPPDTLRIDIKFPLVDGRTLVHGPLTYNQDGLATRHNCEFMRDPNFTRAYATGMQNGNPATTIEWRVHVALWCATQCIHLPGDYVECGVHTGILSGAIMTWLDFGKQIERKFYLFDTWQGIPIEQISDAERIIGVPNMNRKYQNGDELHAKAVEKFSAWSNAVVVRGRVPESLSVMDSSRPIAFASIDMNVAEAEMAAADHLWPRMMPGGYMLLDDYGQSAHINQKRAWDHWALQHQIMILSLPTGQGLIRKP